jgi:hypothetical protein
MKMTYKYAITANNKNDYTPRNTETVLEYLKYHDNHKYISFWFLEKKFRIFIAKNYCTMFRYDETGKVVTLPKKIAYKYIKVFARYCKQINVMDKKGNTFIFKVNE